MKTSKECVTCKSYGKTFIENPCKKCVSDFEEITYSEWTPIEEKYQSLFKKFLKEFSITAKERLWISRIISIIFLGLFTWISFKLYSKDNGLDLKTMISFLSVMYIYGLVCYFSRKPDPQRKGFKKWLKICILKVQIWHKQSYLFWYPDLKKYRGNPKRKAKVWAKRDRLKKLKRELTNI